MTVDDSNPGREMDNWIDDALAHYGKAQPRAGLEERVLARLAETRREPSRTLRWWGALAFSAAAFLALLVVWQQRTKPVQIPSNPVANVATKPRTEEHAAGTTRPLDKNAKPARENQTLAFAQKGSNHRCLAGAETETAPKLEQFPAPQPLSDQEQLLARYVQEFPQKAALMARAQTELHKQDELDMAAPWPNATSSNVEQQE